MAIGPALFIANNLLLAAAAGRLARRAVPGDEVCLRWTAGLVLFVAGAMLAPFTLGLLGLLRPLPLTGAVALLALASSSWRGGAATDAAPPALRSHFRDSSYAEIAMAALLVGALGWWAHATLWIGTGFIWDDLTYHAAVPAWWIRHGDLSLPPFTFQVHYPFNAELISLFLMLPLGHDGDAGAANFLWIALCGAAMLAILQRLDAPKACSWAVVATFLATPRVVELTRFFAPTDLSVAGLTLAAVALALPERGVSSTQRRWLASLSGVAMGCALGTKVSIAPVAVVVGLWWLRPLWRGRDEGGWSGLAPALLHAAPVVLFGSYWYAQNLLATGNPLFPAEIGPFAGPLSKEVQRQTAIVGVLDRTGWSLASMATLLHDFLSWPHALGYLSLFGLTAGPVACGIGWRRARTPEERSRAEGLALLCCVAWVVVILYPTQPYSATANRPLFGLHHLVRYLLLPYAIGLLLLPALIRALAGRSSGHAAWALAPLSAVVASAALGPPHPFLWLPAACWTGLASALAAGGALGGARSVSRAARTVPASVLGVLSLVLLVGLRSDARLSDATARLYALPDARRPIARGWKTLEQIPAGSRVAFVSHAPASHSFFYPQFGRRLQHEVIPLDREGRRERPYAERWREERFGWFEDWSGARPLPPDYVENVRAAGVEFLLVSRWSIELWQPEGDPDWPAAREALLRSSLASRIWSDGYSELYWIRPSLDPPR